MQLCQIETQIFQIIVIVKCDLFFLIFFLLLLLTSLLPLKGQFCLP